MPENLGQVDCDPVGTQESGTLPPLVGESSGNLARQEQQQHQEEGAASPAHTPTPGRWSPHLGVKKNKKKMPEDGNQRVAAARSNSARRKLDLDSSECKTCFSRADLMGNLKSLAKIHGLNSEPTTRKRSKRGKKRKLMVGHKESGQLALLPYQAASFALEPLRYSTELDIPCPQNHGKLQAKVLGLTDETLRVFAVLTKWDRSDSESFEGFDIGSGLEWDTTRRTFEQYVDIFIAEMFDLIGNYSGPLYAFDKCVKNQLNREKVQFQQRTGSRCYIACAYVAMQEKYKDTEPTAIDLFKVTHCSKKTGFCEPVKNAIASMETIQAEPLQEGQQPKSDIQVVAQVLPQSSTFLQNIGLQYSSGTSSRDVASQVQELQAQLESEKQEKSGLQLQVDTLKMHAEESEATMAKQSEEIQNLKKAQEENNNLLRQLISFKQV
ncbi:unnamed protein product [Miscanthus lutarioriparius]|uniref:Uncharacterized protein n=1 Tax=Miscanthus lutarioriparius TaxID=422564 RepID=A0A811PNB4_9POAL|nr:unnamed protein product [Miscanthus lutarioriparius]